MNRFFTKTIRQKRNNIFRYCTFAVLLITAYIETEKYMTKKARTLPIWGMNNLFSSKKNYFRRRFQYIETIKTNYK
jgi:hypothetical protein